MTWVVFIISLLGKVTESFCVHAAGKVTEHSAQIYQRNIRVYFRWRWSRSPFRWSFVIIHQTIVLHLTRCHICEGFHTFRYLLCGALMTRYAVICFLNHLEHRLEVRSEWDIRVRYRWKIHIDWQTTPGTTLDLRHSIDNSIAARTRGCGNSH